MIVNWESNALQDDDPSRKSSPSDFCTTILVQMPQKELVDTKALAPSPPSHINTQNSTVSSLFGEVVFPSFFVFKKSTYLYPCPSSLPVSGSIKDESLILNEVALFQSLFSVVAAFFLSLCVCTLPFAAIAFPFCWILRLGWRIRFEVKATPAPYQLPQVYP